MNDLYLKAICTAYGLSIIGAWYLFKYLFSSRSKRPS